VDRERNDSSSPGRTKELGASETGAHAGHPDLLSYMQHQYENAPSTGDGGEASESFSGRGLSEKEAGSKVAGGSDGAHQQISSTAEGGACERKLPAQVSGVTSRNPSNQQSIPYRGKTTGKGPDDHGKKQPPDRPGHGDRGREIRLYTNFFLLKLPEMMTVYHYDVSIVPEKLTKSLTHLVSREGQRNSPWSVTYRVFLNRVCTFLSNYFSCIHKLVIMNRLNKPFTTDTLIVDVPPEGLV